MTSVDSASSAPVDDPRHLAETLAPVLAKACEGRLSEVTWFRTDWQRGGAVVVTAKDVTEEDRRRINGGVVGLIQKGGLDRESLLAQLREQVAATEARGRSALLPARRRQRKDYLDRNREP